MTTIFGLSFEDTNASVLVADRQTTQINSAGIPVGKNPRHHGS